MIEFDFSGQDPAFQRALLSAGFTPFGGGSGGAQPFTPAFATFAPQPGLSAPQTPFAGGVSDPQDYGGFGPDDAAQAADIGAMEAKSGMSAADVASNVSTMSNPVGIGGAILGMVARDVFGVPQSHKLGFMQAMRDIAEINNPPPNIGAAGRGSLAAEQFAQDVVNDTTGREGGDANGNAADGNAAEDFGFDPSDDHSDQTPDPGDF